MFIYNNKKESISSNKLLLMDYFDYINNYCQSQKFVYDFLIIITLRLYTWLWLMYLVYILLFIFNINYYYYIKSIYKF